MVSGTNADTLICQMATASKPYVTGFYDEAPMSVFHLSDDREGKGKGMEGNGRGREWKGKGMEGDGNGRGREEKCLA